MEVTYKIHTDNSFLVEHEGVVIGAVYLAEDCSSWYCEHISRTERGPLLSDLFSSRSQAAELLVGLYVEGEAAPWADE